MCKINNEQYDGVIGIDGYLVELRITTYKIWNKPSAELLRTWQENRQIRTSSENTFV